MPLMPPDLPEPAWWQHARELEAQGVSRPKIAAALGVAYSTVRYALDPKYREVTKARTLAWQKDHPDAERWVDHDRNYRRQKVRTAWRAAGRVGDLNKLYEEAGCGSTRAKGPRARSDRA